MKQDFTHISLDLVFYSVIPKKIFLKVKMSENVARWQAEEKGIFKAKINTIQVSV